MREGFPAPPQRSNLNRAVLEREPQCKLQHSRRFLAHQCGDHTKRGTGDVGVGQPKVRVIESVEGVRTELQPVFLSKQGKTLCDSQINV